MNHEALIAARRGNLKKLKLLLDEGINVNAQDDNGRTLLHHAASNGQRKAVKCLLQHGADVLVTTDKNNTVLHIAATKSDEALVKVILENVARDKLRKLLDARTKATGTTALHVAAKADRYADASLLLEYGANFESANEAGEKPADLATGERLRELFKLIGVSFQMAVELEESEEEQLADDLQKVATQDFTSVLNCRNGEGRTLMQVMLLDERYRLAADVLGLRVNQPMMERERDVLDDPSRRKGLEKLAHRGREFRECWKEQREAMAKLMEEIEEGAEGTNPEALKSRAVKLGALALEKGHEVLLAFREFEGKQRSVTDDPRMKTLEEAMEAMGFDPERLCRVEGSEASYYDKLPAKLKENPKSMMGFIDSPIDGPIDYLLGYIYSLQNFNAVDDDNMDKVQQLIDKNVMNHGVGRDGRTALYNAVEKGNEAMVELLLEAGAGVYYKGALSPTYLAVKNGNFKLVKMLLDKVYYQELPIFVDLRHEHECTLLHVAAKLGHLDIVKVLLRNGATYCLLDDEGHTPLDVSTDEEVSDFLRFVDECFCDARRSNAKVISKLEALPKDDFLTVTSARNQRGKNVGNEADRVKAKDIAEKIWDMIDRANFKVV